MRYHNTDKGISERFDQHIRICQFVKIYQYKKALFLTGMILICCIFAGILLFHRKTPAAAEADTGFKSYTSIEIKSGDSLWSIASEYMTEDYDSVQEYVREIKSLNGLGGDEIYAGKFLLIPYYLQP